MMESLQSKDIAVNSAHLSIIASQFCFETGCLLFEHVAGRIFQIVNIVPSLIK